MTDHVSAPYGEGDEEELPQEDGVVGLPYSKEQMASWIDFAPEIGSIVEAGLPPIGESAPALGAFGIAEAIGERLYVARYLGTNDHGTEGRHKGLGRMFNTKTGKLHFCLQGRALCEVHQDEDVLHVEDLTWWPPLSYQGELCTAHGKRALKDFNEKFCRGAEAATPKPLEPRGPEASRKQREAPERKGGPPGEFFAGLSELASRAGVGKPNPRPILRPRVTWADRERQALAGVAPALTKAPTGTLQMGSGVKAEPGGIHEVVELTSGSGKSGSPTRKQPTLKRKSLAKEESAKKEGKEEGQETKKRKEQDLELGREYGELMPPVKRKAEKKPGAVMEELVEHARAQLSERERGEGRETLGTGAGGEVKMSLFFQLFWRSKFEHRPRDQRELFLLSRCADLLRDGHLNELADAIAGRIMALEVAASTGNWSTAKYLEVETMDSGSIAKPETLLAAQRHARLVAKSEGSWKRGDGGWWREGKGAGIQEGKGLESGGWQTWGKGEVNAGGYGECRAAGLTGAGCEEAAGWPLSVTSFAELGPWRVDQNIYRSSPCESLKLAQFGEVAKLLERGSSGFGRVDLDSIWTELDKAVLSYTGEEILPLRPLTVDQMEPALPPAGAGGKVNALDLVDGGTRIIGGHIESLPSITKWQSIILGEGETLTAFQCDMACAFYLFSLPDVWLPWFCLNFDLSGHELGIESDERYTIACCTLPMGWKSAVGVMQCISRRVLLESRLPESHEMRKDRSAPPWLVKCWREGGEHSWWQVYLDNFISCQVECKSSSQRTSDGAELFRAALDGWDSFGILCASDKNVEFAGVAHELGAEIDGELGKLSGGTARLWKTCVSSLSQALLNNTVKGKRMQVLAGRWAFLLQFRRPLFAIFSEIWKAAATTCPLAVKRRASLELFVAVLLSPLCSCDLSRAVHPLVVATDASEKGGAICVSTGLSWSGRSLARAWSEPSDLGSVRPLLIISLFNGIGGAFRAYDLAGIRASGLISVECHKPAIRVVKRAWPHALQYDDVHDVDESLIRD
ncbi:Dnmt3b [Symbiodinium sp. CCMP2592]|nr:Dnmt3b [Symbiodinium sp. CCMP2592]